MRNYLLFAMIMLAACGGAGGGGSDSNTGGGSGGGDAPFDPNSVNTNGDPVELKAGIYKITVDGKVYETTLRYYVRGIPILWVTHLSNTREYFTGTDGKWVDIVGVSAWDGSDFHSGFGITGAKTRAIPNGSFKMDGFYGRVNASDQSRTIFQANVELLVDFDTGVMTGHSIDHVIPEQAVSIFGIIDGLIVKVDLVDEIDAYEFDAFFYGPNAEELAGGFQKGNAIGMIYATQ